MAITYSGLPPGGVQRNSGPKSRWRRIVIQPDKNAPSQKPKIMNEKEDRPGSYSFLN
jgi:hypothetical protein